VINLGSWEEHHLKGGRRARRTRVRSKKRTRRKNGEAEAGEENSRGKFGIFGKGGTKTVPRLGGFNTDSETRTTTRWHLCERRETAILTGEDPKTLEQGKISFFLAYTKS